MTGRAAYFLRERLWSAQFTCELFLDANYPKDMSQQANMPNDLEMLLRILVIEDWDKSGVEEWLENEEGSFQEKEEW